MLLLGFQSCQSTSSFMVCAFPSSVRVRDLPTSILWSPEPPFLVWVLQATARGPSRGPPGHGNQNLNPWVGLGIPGNYPCQLLHLLLHMSLSYDRAKLRLFRAATRQSC